MSPTADYDLGTARGRIELDASSLGRASAAFISFGRGMVGFSAVTVGAFAYVVKSAADFERQISAVGAVSNANAQEMDLLRERALELGSQTLYSADQVARAMEQLAKAGIDIPTILGGATDAVVMLAQAAGDELAGGVDAAAEIMANAMKTFGVGADQAMHFADVLVAAAASSTTSVDDMAVSMRYAGPIAAELGLSIDDLGTALAILGDQGIRGSTAGTSLRGVFLGLATQTPKATKVLKELGIVTEDGKNRFFDWQGALKPLPEVMQILQDATADLTQEQRLQAFNTIFQRRAMNSAMILARQGAEGFNEYAAAIAALDAENIAARKLDNLSGDMTILRNSVDALIIQTGLQFQDMLRGWVQGLTEVVQWLRDLDPALLGNILKIAALVGVVFGALGALSIMVGVGIRMYRNLRDLLTAIRLVAGAMRLLTATLLTNPIFLVVVALALLAAGMYLAYQRSETFRNFIDTLFASLKSVVLPVIETIVMAFEAMVAAFQDPDITSEGLVGFFEAVGVGARAVYDFFANDFLPGIVAFFDAIAGGSSSAGGFIGFMAEAGAAVRDVGQWLINVGIPAFLRFMDTVGDVAFDALTSAINFLVDEVFPRIVFVVEETSERVVSAFQWLETNVFPVVVALGELFYAAIERIIVVAQFLWPVFQGAFALIMLSIRQVVTVFQGAVALLMNLWNIFGDNLISAITIAWNFIRSIVSAGLEFIQGIIQIITGIISGDWGRVWEGIKNVLSGIWDVMLALTQAAVEGFFLLIETFLDAIHAAWDIAWQAVATTLKVVWEGIRTTVLTGIDVLKGLIQNGIDFIKGLWNSAWETVLNILVGIWARIREAVGTGIAVLVAFVTEVPGKMITALGNLGQRLWQFFWDAMGRAKEGVEQAVANLINFVKTIPGKIINGLGDLAGRLYQAGKNAIGGLIDGIRDMIPSIGDVMGGIGGFIGGFLPGSPVKEGPLRVLNHGYAGGQILKMIMDGMERQIPTLQRLMNQVVPSIELSPGAGGMALAPSAVAPTITNVYQVGDVLIPAKDLDEMRSVQEFFDRVEQVARQGVSA